jgi:acyl-CoA reductase-like NAD-dependent aldehyde dehydrogenase
MQQNTTNKSLRERLVDEAIERYVDWRHACAAVSDTYQQWSRAPAKERALLFAAYRAALDQEESAATLYGSVLDGSA